MKSKLDETAADFSILRLGSLNLTATPAVDRR